MVQSELEDMAKAGVAEAEYIMGFLLDNGIGYTPDATAAFQWYSRAASKGLVAAQYSLGHMYSTGRDTERDALKAMEYYMRAAEAGLLPAQCMVAYNYEYPSEGIPFDLKEAFHWIQKAASQENVEAMHHLAEMYQRGHGTAIHLDAAFYWYKRAAERGSAEAAFWIAACYHYARFSDERAGALFMETDESEALKWYFVAAEGGSSGALTALVHIYEKGLLGQSVDKARCALYASKRDEAVEAERNKRQNKSTTGRPC